MRLSESGREILVREEGKRLAAYRDHVGNWTIGAGQTTIRGRPVQAGDKLTEAEYEQLLGERIAEFEGALNAYVKVPLTQQQFDALFSWTWNVGIGAMRDSTLLEKLNAGDYAAAADQLLAWDRVTVDGVRRSDPALAARRQRERARFLASEQPPAPIVESKPTWEAKPVPSPFILAALPELVRLIPGLIRVFGSDGRVTERNAQAAEAVLQVVQTATGTTNAQAAVEAVRDDLTMRAAATEALDRENWFAPTEAGGGGIAGAREFNVSLIESQPWRMPALWVTVMFMLPFYCVIAAVLFMPGWSAEIRIQVVTAVLSIAGIIAAFWLGSSFGSQRKDNPLHTTTDVLQAKV